MSVLEKEHTDVGLEWERADKIQDPSALAKPQKNQNVNGSGIELPEVD